MWRSPPAEQKKKPKTYIAIKTLHPKKTANLYTYSDAAREKVCKNVIPNQACVQDQLLGLVITRQLKVQGKNSLKVLFTVLNMVFLYVLFL